MQSLVSRLSSLFAKDDTHIKIEDTEHYGTFAFPELHDIAKLEEVILKQEKFKNSSWYGKLEWVNTFRTDPKIPGLIKDGEEKYCRFIAVLPSKLVRPNGIYGVYQEFRNSFLVFNKVAEKLDADLGNNEDGATLPCIFVSTRVSQLWERKPRQLHLNQAFGKVMSIYMKRFSHKPQIRIAMRKKDALQCGLWQFSTLEPEDFTVSLKNIQPYAECSIYTFSKEELFEMCQALIVPDGLVWDTVFHVHDLKMIGKCDWRLCVREISTGEWSESSGEQSSSDELRCPSEAENSSSAPGSSNSHTKHQISKFRSINPEQIEKLFRVAIPPENFVEGQLKDAVKYIMIHFNVFGYSSEQPLKHIDSGKNEQTHIFRSFGGSTHEFNPVLEIHRFEETPLSRILDIDIFQSSISSGQSQELRIKNPDRARYKLFHKTVLTVDEKGYRVQRNNILFSLITLSPVLLSICYMILRRTVWIPDDPRALPSVEDLLSATLGIITVSTGAIVTLLLSFLYHGEQISDVIRNIRYIDTQKEFEKRAPFQTSDIMEVLRESKRGVPSFLGGGNISFVYPEEPRVAFDAIDPVPFSNIETVGYALYEDRTGHIYMIDRWENLFQVDIVDNNISNSLVDLGSENNIYIQKEFKYSGNKNITLFCKPLASKPITQIYRDDEPNNDQGSVPSTSSHIALGSQEAKEAEPPEEQIGCLLVKYMQYGKRETIFISRILPYGARKRSFGVLRGRTLWGDTMWSLSPQWRYINNFDILRMDIGIYTDLNIDGWRDNRNNF